VCKVFACLNSWKSWCKWPHQVPFPVSTVSGSMMSLNKWMYYQVKGSLFWLEGELMVPQLFHNSMRGKIQGALSWLCGLGVCSLSRTCMQGCLVRIKQILLCLYILL
jgi:hypothetical protein